MRTAIPAAWQRVAEGKHTNMRDMHMHASPTIYRGRRMRAGQQGGVAKSAHMLPAGIKVHAELVNGLSCAVLARYMARGRQQASLKQVRKASEGGIALDNGGVQRARSPSLATAVPRRRRPIRATIIIASRAAAAARQGSGDGGQPQNAKIRRRRPPALAAQAVEAKLSESSAASCGGGGRRQGGGLAGVLIGRAAVFTRSRAGRLIAFTADGQEPPTAPWRTDARALVPAR